MKVLLLTVSALLSLHLVLGGTLGGDVIELMETSAFNICETDKMVGLTWNEVEKCEERFAALLQAQNVSPPTKEDFEASDLNRDGILTLEEWKQGVAGQSMQ